MEETIGVVGCGDLGGSIGNEAITRGITPHFYDVNPASIKKYRRDFAATLDPEVRIDIADRTDDRFRVCSDATGVTRISGPVHFAVPAHAIETFPLLGEDQVGFGHASGMLSTAQAIQKRQQTHDDAGKFLVVHLLMNRHHRAVLDPAFGDVKRGEQHLQKLGLDVVHLSSDEHDRIMAATQGAMLKLMLEHSLELRLFNQAGLISEQGPLMALNNALVGRFATWTDETVRSVAENPHVDIKDHQVENFIRNRKIIAANRRLGMHTDMETLLGRSPTRAEKERLLGAFLVFCDQNADALAEYNAAGFLTPSGEELQQLVERSLVLAG